MNAKNKVLPRESKVEQSLLDSMCTQLRLLGVDHIKVGIKVEGEIAHIYLPEKRIIVTLDDYDFTHRNILTAKGYKVFYAIDHTLIEKSIILNMLHRMLCERC